MQISRHAYRLAFGESKLPKCAPAPHVLPAIELAQAGMSPNHSVELTNCSKLQSAAHLER